MSCWLRPLAVSVILGLCACMSNVQPLDMTDAGIKARVETALRGQPDLDISHLTIDVISRVVTISGMVNSYQEKAIVTRAVRRTKGVDQAFINVLYPE